MTSKKLVVVLVGVLVFLFAANNLSFAQDGETIVTGKCTACHTAERIRSASKTKSGWEQQVDKEIDRGAQLNGEERRTVINWLAENYGPRVVAQNESPQTNTQSSQTQQSLPFNEQAKTGIELWQLLLAGGSLVGSGIWLRRK